ncbi:hypothetical protein ACS5PK_09040 [Roseateles sp. DB2]|uniref:hypothetical protein n=1 Tax=Roseateles sp. DB2 TaxID=3453717 RepID=UPI003EEC1E84
MASPGKKSFLLRLPPELWDEIERLAARELRSSNAQIEYLLREALQRRGIRLDTAPAAKRGRPPKDSEGDEPATSEKGEDR